MKVLGVTWLFEICVMMSYLVHSQLWLIAVKVWYKGCYTQYSEMQQEVKT